MLKDQDIREPLCEYLEEHCMKIRLIDEKQIGKSRADFMMITENAISGIEIKSDADTYQRLERQIRDYNRFFDYNLIVIGETHLLHVAEHVPDWWGIFVVREAPSLRCEMIRRPEPNPKREKKVKLRNQLNFLWRMEMAILQEWNHMPKYKEKSKKFVVEKIMEKVDHELLKKQICQLLFERDYTTVSEKIAECKKTKK